MGTITNNSKSPAVCQAVRAVRLEKGISQVQVAEALNLLQPYVSAWERFRVPTVDQIRQIEGVLGVAPGTILRRAGYVEDIASMRIEHHIKLDPDLSAESKKALVEFLDYRRALDGVPPAPADAPTPRRTRRARNRA